jgi:hypothetical protein
VEYVRVVSGRLNVTHGSTSLIETAGTQHRHRR